MVGRLIYRKATTTTTIRRRRRETKLLNSRLGSRVVCTKMMRIFPSRVFVHTFTGLIFHSISLAQQSFFAKTEMSMNITFLRIVLKDIIIIAIIQLINQNSIIIY